MSLVLDNLAIGHGGVAWLDGVSASFERGKLTTVIGRTLAGKTTLMRVIAGLQGVKSGQIELDGKPITNQPAWQRDVAMVYQQFINYPHLSVFENVAFPLRRQKVAEPEVKARVERVLETVGLATFRDRRPSALSGGQQQRVALARALVRRAGILLLDEPLVNLDYKLREQLRDEFRRLFADQAATILIYNTTEPAEAIMLGDQVIVMHQGRVLQAGTPGEIFDRPASALVAGIINDPAMNLMGGEIDSGGITFDGGARIPLPAHLSGLGAGRYRFGARPNEIERRDDGGIIGRATFSEVSGSETFIHFDAPFGEGVLQLEGVHSVALNDPVPITVRPDRLFVFAADGDGALLRSPAGGKG